MSQLKEEPMIMEIRSRLKIIQNTVYLQRHNKKYWYKKLMNTIKKIMVCTVLTEQVKKTGKLPKKKRESIIKINHPVLNKKLSSPSNEYQKLDTNSHSPSIIESPTKLRDSDYMYPLNTTKRNLISNRSIEMSSNKIEIANSQNDSITNIEQHIRMNNEFFLLKVDSSLPQIEEKDELGNNIKETEEVSNFSYQQTFNKDPNTNFEHEENDDTILLKNRIIFNEDIAKQFKVCEKERFTIQGKRFFKKYNCKDISFVVNEGDRKFLFPYLISKNNYPDYALNCFIYEIKSITINRLLVFFNWILSIFKYFAVFSFIMACWILISFMLQSLLIEYGYRIIYLWLVPNIFINLFKYLVWDQAILLFFVMILFKNKKHFLTDHDEKVKNEKKNKIDILFGLLPDSSRTLFKSIIEFKKLYKEIEEKKR
jgi:hypothetical protein